MHSSNLVVAKWFHSQLLTNSRCSRKELHIPGWKIPDCPLLVEFPGSGEHVRFKRYIYIDLRVVPAMSSQSPTLLNVKVPIDDYMISSTARREGPVQDWPR